MNPKTKQTVLEMTLGIGLYILFMEVVGMIITKGPRASVVLGILSGGVIAAVITVHMANSLEIAMDSGENGAKKKMILSSIMRGIVIMILIAIAYVTGYLNIPAIFFGMLGLKAGAYLQPHIKKLLKQNKNETIGEGGLVNERNDDTI